MTFSVIIPAFNAENQIARALDSLVYLNAMFSFEVIVIDDYSEDKTSDLVTAYKNRLSLKLIVNKKNLGAAQSRNIGVENARFEKIVFNDCDDKSLACRFIVHAEHFERNANLSFVSSIKQYGRREVKFKLSDQENFWLRPEQYVRYILLGERIGKHEKLHFPTASMAITKSFFNEIGGFDTRFSRNEDVDLLIRSLEKSALISTSSLIGVYRHSEYKPHQRGDSNLNGELALLKIHGSKFLSKQELTASRRWFLARSDYFERRYISAIKNLLLSAAYRPSRLMSSLVNRIPKRLYHDLRNARS